MRNGWSSRSRRAIAFIGLVAMGACQSSRAATKASELVYVSNEDSGDISVIDPARMASVGSILVGKRPRGVRVSQDAKVYVALSGSAKGGPNVDESRLPPPDRAADGIGVVDAATRKLLRTLPSGADPEAFDLVNDQVFVSNEDTAQASIVSATDGKVVQSIGVGAEPEGVTARPDGKVVYVTSEADNRVDVIDVGQRRVVARIAVGARPRSVAFLADGSRAYVTNELSASVSVIEASAHTVLQTIRLPAGPDGTPPKPMGIVIAPDGEHAYVTTGRAGGIIELTLRGNAATRSLHGVGARPWGIGITRDGRTLYVANGPSNDVSVVDIAAWSVTKRIPVGRSPWGIAVGP